MNTKSLRRVLSLLQQDLTNALRDNILLYMMVAPLILALGASLFLPSLDRVTVTFAVQEGVDPALVERLDQYGQVELYADRAGVEERVLRMDDVAGIIPAGVIPDAESVRVLLEGTEGDSSSTETLVSAALSPGTLASYTHTRVGSAHSLLTEYGTMTLLMVAVLLGALVMTFNLIEDKESRAVRALGVSPLSMLELTLARGLFAVGLSYILVIATTLILLGPSANYGLLTIGFLFSVGLPVLIGYAIGGLADTQLKAIAILKFAMLIYLTLPIITVFLPRELHPWFYILPNYWMWTVFENVFIGQLGPVGFWGACAITLASSLALVAATIPVLRRQLKLR